MSFRPKLIENEVEHEAAIRELGYLWDLQPDEGTAEFQQLELLGHLIEEYEKGAFPIDAPDPVAAIQFYMEQHDLEQTDLARLLNSRSRASEILSGKKNLSLRQIRMLRDAWDIPAECLIQPVCVEA